MTGTSSTKQREAHIVRTGALRLPEGEVVEITAATSPLLLGRDGHCNVSLDDAEVSAVHAEIRAEPEGVLLRDLGSRNGTFVGAVRIREGFLSAPCTIQIGRTLLRFDPGSREHVDLAKEDYFGELWGRSPRMRQLFRQLREIAPTDLSVLVTGETGTGKELVARALHTRSRRAEGPFVVVDCTCITPSLAEDQLFGHEKGAYTGAVGRTQGAFHAAHGGTLFLDEIGDLPLDLQPKLLRALAEKKIKRVGAAAYESADVRVVAATLQELGRRTNAGTFRSDLFFRIAQVRVALPPLRDRRDDIEVIVRAMCERIGRAERSAEMVELVTTTLAQHDWPGNVRELVNLVAAAAALPPDAESLLAILPIIVEPAPTSARAGFGAVKRDAIAAFEKAYFSSLFQDTTGNVSEMARRAEMERHHVRAYLKRYGLGSK